MRKGLVRASVLAVAVAVVATSVGVAWAQQDGEAVEVAICANPGGQIVLVADPADCTQQQASYVLPTAAGLEALKQELIEGRPPAVRLAAVTDSQDVTLPNSGQFVELLTLPVTDADELLVTTFFQLDGGDCQEALDVTGRVLFDGQTMAEYPPMTSTLAPGTFIVPGLGGPIDVYEYDQGYGAHEVTLEAAVSSTSQEGLPDCVKVGARNMNAVILAD